MTVDELLDLLKAHANADKKAGLQHYAIPSERALGIAMGDMKKLAKGIGKDHALALQFWRKGWYEARIMAIFLDEPSKVTQAQMDRWCNDFDSWAICDTACFHLFDRTFFARDKVFDWAPLQEEFVRRAAYSLIWALSVHDKASDNTPFLNALELIANAEADGRPLVNKAINMALRAVGKCNLTLNQAVQGVAAALEASKDKSKSWIGGHARKELTSEKVLRGLRQD